MIPVSECNTQAVDNGNAKLPDRDNQATECDTQLAYYDTHQPDRNVQLTECDAQRPDYSIQLPDCSIFCNVPDPRFEEFVYPSLFGDAEVFTMETDDGSLVRVLYVGGGFQSATYLDERRFQPVFAYYAGMDLLFDPAIVAHPIHKVLMIGGGAFSYPKHLLTSRKDVAIDVVEIDPAVIEIARRHFFVDILEEQHGEDGTERLRSFACDGIDFQRRCADATYDAIINDSFSGTVQEGSLLSLEALEESKRLLATGGVYLLNAVCEDEDGNTDEDALEAVRARLNAVFAEVRVFPIVDENFNGATNHLLLAWG